MDCTVNESVVVTVEWGTAEKRAMAAEIPEVHPEVSSKVVLPEAVFPASPVGSVAEEKAQVVEDAREGFSLKAIGADIRAKSIPRDSSCVNLEEIIVVCHQGVVEKCGHPLADSTLCIHADKVGSQSSGQVSDSDSRRPFKLTQWDVAVERKRVVKKEARDNGVQFAKTLHTEVAKCTHPGSKNRDRGSRYPFHSCPSFQDSPATIRSRFSIASFRCRPSPLRPTRVDRSPSSRESRP